MGLRWRDGVEAVVSGSLSGLGGFGSAVFDFVVVDLGGKGMMGVLSLWTAVRRRVSCFGISGCFILLRE